MKRFFDSKPGSIFCASRMLRINKPAPTRATRDSAISETTSRLRSLFRPQPIDPPRTPILRVSAKSGTEARKAGARPNNSPVKMEIASVKSKTRKSNDKSMSFCSMNGGRKDQSTVRPTYAIAKPVAPPTRASRMHSVSICRISRGLLAPRAARRPISFSRRARKKQIGQICASDQKHQPHHGHHHRAGKPNLVVHVDAHGRFGQGRQRDAAPGIVFRKVLFELRGDGLQRSLSLAQPRLWLEPCDGQGVQKSSVVEKLFGEPGESLGIHAGGNPDLLGTAESKCPFETFRRHADDGVRHGIQRQRFANRIFVRAELVGPKAVTDDRHVIAAQLAIFIGQKKTSGGGAQA